MNRSQVIEQLPALRRYARVLTGDAWAADDLVQDTLERACSKWLLWRTESDLRAWLFTMMHNLYLNQRRALPALPTLDLDEVEDRLPGTPSRTDDALDLERCLQRLPTDQRAVLLLVAMEDRATKTRHASWTFRWAPSCHACRGPVRACGRSWTANPRQSLQPLLSQAP